MRKIIFLVLLIIALLVSLQFKSWIDSNIPTKGDTNTPISTSTPTVPPTPITMGTTTIIGNFVCLPHAGNPEVITLECAFGLKATDGIHYGLDWADNARFDMNLPMDRQVSVTGTLTPISGEQKYDIVAILKVTGYEVVTKDIPIHSVGSTFDMSLGKSVIVNDTKITAEKVLEDSRCPADVVCIQMGKAVVSFVLETLTGSTSAVLESGSSTTTDTLSIKLNSVMPYPKASDPIEDSEYIFNVTVNGK